MAQNDLWNKLYKRLKEVSVAAADFAEEQAIIGKLKFEILTLKNKIDRHHRDIGQRVVELARLSKPPSAYNDADIQGNIQRVAELSEQIEAKREEITKVTEMFRARAAAHQEKKTREAAQSTTKASTPTAKPAPKPAAKPKPKPKPKPAEKKPPSPPKSEENG